jgi:hypothetical protein
MSYDYEAPGRGRAIAGVLATILWLALWTFAIWGDHSAATLVRRETALTLTDWAGLAAVILAPIGVLWLVLGYFQHAAALAYNTAVLQAQQRSLTLQTEQTAGLIQEHARQAAAAATLAELELAAHRRHEETRRALLTPDFRFTNAAFSAGHRVATFSMVNTGGTAYALQFESADFTDGRIRPAEVVERNAAFSLLVSLDPVLRDRGGTFAIRCRDVEGREHVFPFRTEEGAIRPADLPSRPRAPESVSR